MEQNVKTGLLMVGSAICGGGIALGAAWMWLAWYFNRQGGPYQ